MEKPLILDVNLLTNSAQLLVDKAQSATGVEGDWSPTILIGHLSDVDEQVWQARIPLMVAAHRAGESGPIFKSWEPDESATIEKHSGSTLQEVSEGFLKARRIIARELSQLAGSDWAASAQHETFGKLTLLKLVKFILAHDVEHSKALKD